MIYLPKINPISFTQLSNKQNVSPDLGGEFYGVDIVNPCRLYPVDKTLVFIFESDSTTPVVMVGSTSVSTTDITPSGWDGQGTYVYQVEYINTAVETVYFYLIEDGNFWESEPIKYVEEWELADLTKIDYKNSENDYGYIGSQTMTVYYYGQFVQTIASNEMDVYRDDRGEVTKLNATPVEAYIFSLEFISKNAVNQLGLIFSCDDIEINGQPFQNEDPPEATRIEQSTMFSVDINIFRVDDDYSYYNNSTDGLAFIGDNTDLILSDNENSMVIL